MSGLRTDRRDAMGIPGRELRERVQGAVSGQAVAGAPQSTAGPDTAASVASRPGDAGRSLGALVLSVPRALLRWWRGLSPIVRGVITTVIWISFLIAIGALAGDHGGGEEFGGGG